MADTKHTLYGNSSQTRFYWIPDGAALPAGPYVLRSLTGARLEVDRDAAEPYKITEDRARELTREVVAKVTQQAGSFLSGLGALMQEVAKKQTPPGAPSAEAPPADERKDADEVLEGLRDLWDGLQAAAKDAVETSKEVDAATRERIKRLAEQAGSNVEAAEAAAEQFGAKVVDLLQHPELKRRIEEATKRLKDLADELGQNVPGRGERPAGENRPVEE